MVFRYLSFYQEPYIATFRSSYDFAFSPHYSLKRLQLHLRWGHNPRQTYFRKFLFSEYIIFSVEIRHVARNLQWGGCFGGWKQHQTMMTQILNRLSRFSVQIWVISKKKVFTEIVNVFLSKFRCSPKKNGLQPGCSPLFPVQITSSHSPIFIANIKGGLFLFLAQKSASTVLKAAYFAYSSGQWGKL